MREISTDMEKAANPERVWRVPTDSNALELIGHYNKAGFHEFQ